MEKMWVICHDGADSWKNGRRTWKRKVEKNIAQLAVREMQAGNDADLTLRFLVI